MRRYWIIMFLFLWLMSIMFINLFNWSARASLEKVLRRPSLSSSVESPRESSVNISQQVDRLKVWFHPLRAEIGQKEVREGPWGGYPGRASLGLVIS
jgi:hypothetical protein